MTTLLCFLLALSAHAQGALRPGPPSGSRGEPLATLLQAQAVEVEGEGVNIETLHARIRNLTASPHLVLVPAGTYFRTRDASVQNMVVTRSATVRLAPRASQVVTLAVACANKGKSIPGRSDRFDVQQEGVPPAVERLFAAPTTRGLKAYALQAAVWMLTDDATYAGLGTLQTRFGRAIGATRAAGGLKACQDAGIDVAKLAIWNDRGELIRLLREDEQNEYWDPADRREASALRRWLEQGYKDGVRDDLASPSAARRASAARAVVRYRLPGAAASLLPLLEDRDGEVRVAAATALGELGDRTAAPALIKYVDGVGVARWDGADCRAGATALGLIGDSAAADVLVKKLPRCGEEAAVALGLLRDPRAVPPLLAVARSANRGDDSPDYHLRGKATIALARLGAADEVLELVKARGPDSWHAEALALLRENDQAIRLLLSWLRLRPKGPDDFDVRSYAAEELGKTGRRDVIGPLIEVMAAPGANSIAMTRENKTVADYAAASLRRLTGQKFGTNVAAWRAWWKARGR